VDVFNTVFRAHYACRGLTHEGIPTGAYHGFFHTVLSLRKISKRLVFCFDQGLPGDPRRPCWHQALFPDYKAARRNREASNDVITVRDSLRTIHQVLGWLNHPCVGIPGLEADDLIGILSEQEQGKVLIYTTDKDMHQLLTHDGRVQVLRPGKVSGKNIVVTAQQVEKLFQIPIERWPVYLALGGDSSDGIKPLPGMGPKTAQKLVQAGIDPCVPFHGNPSNLKFSKLKPVWKRVQDCYAMALIPRHPNDCRIRDCMKDYLHRLDLRTTPLPDRFQKFTTFCADRGLVFLLSARREFF
jgi:5'-3' exonuclease